MNDSCEGGRPMYGHCAPSTVRARSSLTNSSITDWSVLVRYLNRVGSAAITASRSLSATRGGGAWDSRVTCAHVWMYAAIPSASFGNCSARYSITPSTPVGRVNRSPSTSTAYRSGITIRSRFDATPRASR